MTYPRHADGPLWAQGALTLAALIRDGVVSSREVVQAHLDRVAEVNPSVNAVTSVMGAAALAEAGRVDERIAAGHPVGELAGVPFTVKDNIDVAGEPTTEGVTAFENNHALLDAPVVAALRAAGAIPFARTNMPDFGMRWHTESGLHGATVNPWDPARVPYGSSGGEAVALATGMSPLGLGNDYGGSIRLPSSAAGVVGLRPTEGRVPAASTTRPEPPTPTLQMFAVEGPMGRRVEDVAAAFGLLCRPDPRDPLHVPVPAELPDPGRVTVAVTTDPGGAGVHPDIAAAVRKAADVLSDAGCDVVEKEPPDIMAAAELWRTLSTAEMRGLIDGPMRAFGSHGALAYLTQSIAHVKALDLDGYIHGLARRHTIAAAWSQFTAHAHVVLGPVSTALPFAVGFDTGGPDNADALWLAHRLVVAVNMLGLPALTVPAGRSREGLPLGVQLIGGRYRESLCLRLGALIEQATPALTPIDPIKA